MNERYLIINADDFGLCEAVNRAVCELFSMGAVTSASLLSTARLAESACRTAVKEGFPVGVHWTLFSEWEEDLWPAASEKKAGFAAASGGYLPADGGAAAKRAASREVTAELDAQICRMKNAGCFPDHADSHGGTLYGINGRLFFINAFRLCRKHRLPFRFARSSAFLERQLSGAVTPALKAAQSAVCFLADRMKVPLLQDCITNPCRVEKIENYEALCHYYEQQLFDAPAGISEIFLHPSRPDSRLAARTPQWRKREWEYEFLKSGRLARFVEKEGFLTTSWGKAPFSQRL